MSGMVSSAMNIAKKNPARMTLVIGPATAICLLLLRLDIVCIP
jgi:hypothetical protein